MTDNDGDACMCVCVCDNSSVSLVHTEIVSSSTKSSQRSATSAALAASSRAGEPGAKIMQKSYCAKPACAMATTTGMRNTAQAQLGTPVPQTWETMLGGVFSCSAAARGELLAQVGCNMRPRTIQRPTPGTAATRFGPIQARSMGSSPKTLKTRV